jgi:hypothetical protein
VSVLEWNPRTDHNQYLTQILRYTWESGSDIYSLPRSIQFTYLDVSEASDNWESTLIKLLDFRNYDMSRLRWRDPNNIAKPQIDLYLSITDKGNLCLRWRPAEHVEYHVTNEPTDFTKWMKHPFLNNFSQPGGRPNNELLFIRGVGSLARYADINPVILQLQRYSLYAARALINRMVRFLGQLCDVRVMDDFRFVLGQDEQVKQWDIVDVADAWAESFQTVSGISLHDFCVLLSPHVHAGVVLGADKLSKTLRAHGAIKMTPKVVESLAMELKRYADWPDFRRRHAEIFSTAQLFSNVTK